MDFRARSSGVLYAIAAFLIWGILPLYWKAMIDVPALEILAHRIVWSFAFMLFLILCGGYWQELKKLFSKPSKLIAITFGLYGLLKKTSAIEPMIGLGMETLMLAPFALGYIILLHNNGGGTFGNCQVWISLLLAGSGIITSIPLICFARAAQRIPLSVLGFTQYLAPTAMLIIGLFTYHETFTVEHLVSFGFIWSALTLFSCSKAEFPRKVISFISTGRKSSSKNAEEFET